MLTHWLLAQGCLEDSRFPQWNVCITFFIQENLQRDMSMPIQSSTPHFANGHIWVQTKCVMLYIV